MQNTGYKLKHFIEEKTLSSLFSGKEFDSSIFSGDILYLGEDCETQLFGDKYDETGVYGFPSWSSEYIEYFYQIAGTNSVIVVGVSIPEGEQNEIDPIELAGKKISRENFEIRKDTVSYEPDKSKRMCDFDWVDKLSKKYHMDPNLVLKIGDREDFYKEISSYYFDIKDPLTYAMLQEKYKVSRNITVKEADLGLINKFIEELNKGNDSKEMESLIDEIFHSDADEKSQAKTIPFIPIKDIREKCFSAQANLVIDKKGIEHDIAQYILESFARGPQPNQKIISLECANKDKYAYEVSWSYKKEIERGRFEEESISLFASRNVDDIMKYIKANAGVFSRDEFEQDVRNKKAIADGKITIKPIEMLQEIDMRKSIADFVDAKESFRENEFRFKIGNEEISNETEVHDFSL